MQHGIGFFFGRQCNSYLQCLGVLANFVGRSDTAERLGMLLNRPIRASFQPIQFLSAGRIAENILRCSFQLNFRAEGGGGENRLNLCSPCWTVTESAAPWRPWRRSCGKINDLPSVTQCEWPFHWEPTVSGPFDDVSLLSLNHRRYAARDLLPGTDRHPHALRRQEASGQSSQNGQVWIARGRHFDRWTRAVRTSFPRVHGQSHRIDANRLSGTVLADTSATYLKIRPLARHADSFIIRLDFPFFFEEFFSPHWILFILGYRNGGSSSNPLLTESDRWQTSSSQMHPITVDRNRWAVSSSKHKR